MNKTEYITQIDVAKKSHKKRQWINYLVNNTNTFDTEIVLGKKVIVYNQKVINFLKENE